MSRHSATGQARSDATRTALVTAATEVFARAGFEAVGTREIATAAGVHPALIGYHFGGKDGLYLAVYEHMATAMGQRIEPALAAIEHALAEQAAPPAMAARALDLLGQLCDAMLATLADEASGPWGPLMMREQQAPTPAFDLVYERFMKRVLDTMTRLVQSADPSFTASEARLTVVTLMGQMMVFRVGRAGVMRHLGWKHLGPAQLAEAQGLVRRNLQRLLAPAPAATEARSTSRSAPPQRVARPRGKPAGT